jgi:hypothetical protein
MADRDGDEELSEYERARLRNIERNNEMLRALGLDKSDIDEHNAVSGRGRGHAKSTASADSGVAQGAPDDDVSSKRGRKRASSSSSPAAPTRESRRVRGLRADSDGTRQVNHCFLPPHAKQCAGACACAWCALVYWCDMRVHTQNADKHATTKRHISVFKFHPPPPHLPLL